MWMRWMGADVVRRAWGTEIPQVAVRPYRIVYKSLIIVASIFQRSDLTAKIKGDM